MPLDDVRVRQNQVAVLDGNIDTVATAARVATRHRAGLAESGREELRIDQKAGYVGKLVCADSKFPLVAYGIQGSPGFRLKIRRHYNARHDGKRRTR
jgi:hypothetical protein